MKKSREITVGGVGVLGVGFGAFICWDQWHWWSGRQDYSFGFLVPVFGLVVLWDRWPRLRQLLYTQLAAEVKASDDAVRLTFGWLTDRYFGFAKWFVPAGFYAGLVIGLLVFGLGVLYRAGAGPSYPGSLFIALGGGASVFSLLYICLPLSPRAGEGAHRRSTRTRRGNEPAVDRDLVLLLPLLYLDRFGAIGLVHRIPFQSLPSGPSGGGRLIFL